MMTPKEVSRFCVMTVGYGINHSVIQTIQDDALKDLLNRLLVPTIKIEHNLLTEFEAPMTTAERIEWAVNNLIHK